MCGFDFFAVALIELLVETRVRVAYQLIILLRFHQIIKQQARASELARVVASLVYNIHRHQLPRERGAWHVPPFPS